MVAPGSGAHDGNIVGEGAPTVGRWHDEGGATAVEYGLIVGAVGIAFIVAGPMLWQAFLALFEAILCDMVGGVQCGT